MLVPGSNGDNTSQHSKEALQTLTNMEGKIVVNNFLPAGGFESRIHRLHCLAHNVFECGCDPILAVNIFSHNMQSPFLV